MSKIKEEFFEELDDMEKKVSQMYEDDSITEERFIHCIASINEIRELTSI